MQIQTKFLWLPKAAVIEDHIDGWRACWLGGCDRCKVFSVVMVVKEYSTAAFTPELNSVDGYYRLMIGCGGLQRS